MSIVVLDFEMNPIRPPKGNLTREIIEIGAVRLDDQYQVADRISILVKPQFASIDSKIKKLTGLDEAYLRHADVFDQAIQKFAQWIGGDSVQIYGWSDSDEIQFRKECEYKQIEVPANMETWIDFQPIYKEKMEIRSEGLLSLQKAAGWHGIKFDKKEAHRAGYDAEITAALVRSVLTCEYKKYLKMIKKILEPEEEETFGQGLAGLLAGLKM